MPMIVALLAALLMGIPQTATISGKVLDRTGQLLANAQIVYTHTELGRVLQIQNQQERGIHRNRGSLRRLRD